MTDLRDALVSVRNKPLRAALEAAQVRSRATRRTSDELSWQGPWDSTRRYRAGDVVFFEGSSWRALIAHTDVKPPPLPATASAVWELVARKGDPGAIGARGFIGPTGPQGPPGNDLEFEDEGVPLGTATTVDFVGTGVTATLVAGVVTVTVPGGDAQWTPTFIAVGETFTVPVFKQVLFATIIDNEGTLDVQGMLVEVD